jgi:hypothetical protein
MLDLWKNGHYAHECPENEAPEKEKENCLNKEPREVQERKKQVRFPCNQMWRSNT